MRILPAGLQEHFDSATTTLCSCWRLQARNGVTHGFTDHDKNLSFDGITFEAVSGFTGTQIESGLGFSIDNMDVAGALSSEKLNERDLSSGVYDDADVEIWLVNWRNVSQRILQRKGTLGEVSRGTNSFTAEIRGMTHQLNQPKGRLFQFSCDARLGDARCRVNTADSAFNKAGTVNQIVSSTSVYADGLALIENGWPAFGLLTFVTGENTGQSLEVKNHVVTSAGVKIDFWSAPAAPIATGDQFTVVAGCDKTFATCRDKFFNSDNFRGFPHMPGNDFVAFYPNGDDGDNDGSALV